MGKYELCILNTLKYPTGITSQEVKELGKSNLSCLTDIFISYPFYFDEKSWKFQNKNMIDHALPGPDFLEKGLILCSS